MQQHKARRLLLLILATILLLSGCSDNVSYILPPDPSNDTNPSVAESTAALTTAPLSTDHQHCYTQSVVEPTCTDMGCTIHTCECGDSYTDNQIDKLGHSYVVSTVAPTATEQGYDLHLCSRCGDSYKDSFTDKLLHEPTDHTHSYTESVVEPTCTDKGYTKYACSCGVSYIDRFVEALGHDFKVTTVSPTANSMGYDLHQCSRCGYSYKDHYTDKLPSETTPPTTDSQEPQPTEHKHSYTKTVVDPTCTEKGYNLYTCTCGDSYRNAYTDPLGHDYKVTVVLPTTEERGYNLHTCKRCNHTYKDNYVDKLPAHTEPPETEPPEPPQYDNPVYDISDHVVGSLEYEILAELNARRAAEGLSELKMDKKLCALSAIRAYECSVSFSHTRPNGTSCFTLFSEYNYKGGSIAGENLLYASSGKSAASLVDAWMDSSSHRNNILSTSFTKAGIGVYYSGGRIYVANFFVG